MLRIESISKLATDPPVFYCQTPWGRVRTDAGRLMDPYKFSVAVAEQVSAAPALPKTAEWREHIHPLLQGAEIIEAPDDASEEGSVGGHVRKFCTGRSQAVTRDEILSGRPFTEGKLTYFRSMDLVAFLRRQGVTISPARLYEILRNLKGRALPPERLKGALVRLWEIPAPEGQTEPFDMPPAIAKGAQVDY